MGKPMERTLTIFEWVGAALIVAVVLPALVVVAKEQVSAIEDRQTALDGIQQKIQTLERLVAE